MRRDDNAGGAADFAHLFDSHDVREHVAAGAAHLFGEIDAHHAQFRHLFDGLDGEVFLGVDLLGERLDFILSKLLVHFLYHLLLFGQSKIHLFILPILKQTPWRGIARARRESCYRITARPPGSWCGRRCRRRSPCRSCSPGCRRGPSCGSAGRRGTCCRRSLCRARP